MSEPVYIVDVIRDIVAATSAVLLSQLQLVDPLITGVYFEYGHYNDIRERLTTKDKQAATAVKRYPLIALFEDFKLRKGTEGLTGITDLKMIILYPSRNDVTRIQREATVFRPILYPIYNELLKQFKVSGKFSIYDTTLIKHDQINRPHWGDPGLYGNNSYLFNDVLDGIELNNLQLTTFLNNCL